ncbi:response regulator transcription factor [Tepidiforma sp.]|uniref:response regulator transcription factor n=1 Tax=Tepidiforma sp. TaxID=2682230 RepID=UPI002ADDCBA7|nr:response regulator transcription factor [Tepidiforma sp.]
MPGTRRRDAAELPPPVGLRIAVVSQGLDRAYDRARGLEANGYRVTAFGDALASEIAASRPDAVVIDLGREVGFPSEAVQRVREASDAPVVVVGCTGSISEMLRCFEAGADDYCRPKCPTEEIDLRLRALLRRIQMTANGRPTANGSPAPGRVRVGAIEIDPASQTVWKNGVEVPLSPTEYRLLATLAEHPGEVIPSRALIARVWGNQYTGESHYLRLYVRYLRQKLEDDPSRPAYIVNRWGSGYALEEPKRAAMAG